MSQKSKFGFHLLDLDLRTVGMIQEQLKKLGIAQANVARMEYGHQILVLY